MIINHNLSAMNTNRQLGITTSNLSKATEKLSSGYRINRAADDAAGLAISEKMRSQIRGLNKASMNASDGISLIQTAEGALSEVHSVLQRIRELAVQASNGTETDDDRSNIQDEIEQLQDEIDRISTDTEFNTMSLLDGSLSSASTTTDAGPKFGVYDWGLQAYITSDISGVYVDVSTSAVKGGESAIWDESGKQLTLNLAANNTYSQSEIDELVKNAKQEDSTALHTPANINISLKNGAYTAPATGVGERLDHNVTVLNLAYTNYGGYYDQITSNKTGQQVLFNFGNYAGNESASYSGNILTLNLDKKRAQDYQYGINGYYGYSDDEINKIIATANTGAVSFSAVHKVSTETGIKASSGVVELFDPATDEGKYIGANKIQFISNKYGVDTNIGLTMDTLASTGNEGVFLAKQAEYDSYGNLNRPACYNLSLCSGKEYTEADIEELFAKAGLDMTVKLSSDAPDEPDTLFVVGAKQLSGTVTRAYDDGTTVKQAASIDAFNLGFEGYGYDPVVGHYYHNDGATFGRGLGDNDAFLGEANYGTKAGGSGITLQIGANQNQTLSFAIDNMSSAALGVNSSNVNASTQDKAMKSIDAIDKGIAIVSKQRALLGAVQNRLEHTISNLDNTAENLQSAESSIRDADMAELMVDYSKFGILQQAGQSMLAQANQAQQGVLSLLQG